MPATITLFRVQPLYNQTPEQWEQTLRKCIAKSSAANAEKGDKSAAEFLSFDQGTFEWVFKVPHFTKWGLDQMVDEEKDDGGQHSGKDPVVNCIEEK